MFEVSSDEMNPMGGVLGSDPQQDAAGLGDGLGTSPQQDAAELEEIWDLLHSRMQQGWGILRSAPQQD